MLKKNLLMMLCAVVCCASASAQAITVKEEKAPLRNAYGEGYEALLEGATYDEVQHSFSRWMKAFGKTKADDQAIVIDEPTIGETPVGGRIFAQVRQMGDLVSAWIGILRDEWSRNDIESINPQLKQMVYDFAVHFHKEKIQRQIDESVRASEAVDKQLQRLRNQNRDLTGRIEDNKQEKIELEQSLEENKLELEDLTKRMEKNLKDQDSVSIAAAQIKKAIEMHKLRRQQVQ